MRETFSSRVQALHDSWAERRHLARLAGARELAPVVDLLAVLHGWSMEAARDIEAVYGDSMRVTVAARPRASDAVPCFSVTIAEQYVVTFSLDERRRAGGTSWHIVAMVHSPGTRGPASAGPERRNGQWTRTRLEEVLLTMLGAAERARSTAEADGPRARPEPDA